MCAGLMQARRGHHPLELELQMVRDRELGVEPRSSKPLSHLSSSGFRFCFCLRKDFTVAQIFQEHHT